jgi:hypothetical protein
MAGKLSFEIQTPLQVNQQLNDNGGNWQYVGANIVEGPTHEAVKLIAIKRDNSTAGVGFGASMLTATVMFASQENGVADHLTIQGLHDLTSNNEIGSVSSASSRYAEYIGGSFSFTEGVLTVWPRQW